MTDYRPIPCADYSAYELAILHGETLRLIWREANVIYDQEVVPLDLQTRRHEEFLIFRPMDNQVRRVRLDRIRQHHAC